MNKIIETKYEIHVTKIFKQQYRKILKQDKDVNKLILYILNIGSHSDLFK